MANKKTTKKATSTAIAHKTEHHKKVKIKHHHAKPYRKRHYGVLGLLLVGAIVIFVLAIVYQGKITQNAENAKQYLTELFNTKTVENNTITSTSGFSLSYDPAEFYATALDAASGDIFIGNELNYKRNYQVVRISPTFNEEFAKSSLTLEQYAPSPAMATKEDVQNVVLQSQKAASAGAITIVSTKDYVIDGNQFVKSDWKIQYEDSLSSQITPKFTTYSGIVNGLPTSIVVTYGPGESDTKYDSVVSSISFSSPIIMNLIPPLSTVTNESRTIFDSLLFSNIAQAASVDEVTTEYISSLYSPAVVRVYNAYCKDIYVSGVEFVTNLCNGGVGSGFFVSSDGYIATNGHVAGSSPKDLAIQTAINYLYYGDDRPLNFLVDMTDLEESDVIGKTPKEALAIIVNAAYELPDSEFTSKNDITNLYVTLGEAQPDVEELVKVTKLKKEFTEQDTIKRAELKAMDYRVLDGIDGFNASDVALIKIEGSNFPITNLGAISDVSQGSELNILGFPANANDNALVSDTTSKVTLTSGKVSAIKDAQGNGNKLIETDTVIGHGNSGGPAMNDNGAVVGIATYTIDGSGEGNGVFNYIRDINDLKTLASNSSITFNTSSKTQDEWQKGVDNFYTAHYSKSIKNFNKVLELYPAHPSAASLIETANVKIAAGEDVKDFPLVPFVIGLVVVLAAAGVTGYIIIRHKKKHALYQHHVAAGNMQPMTPGMPPQYVPAQPPQTYMQPPVQMAPQSYNAPQQPNMIMPSQQPQVPAQPPQQPQQQFTTPTVITPTQPPQEPKL